MCLSGGWKQRKQVDPILLHFFFDHWMFKWLPEKFRDLMKFGIAPYTKKELGLDKKDTVFSLSMV